MTETQKIKALATLIHAVVHATEIADGLDTGSQAAADRAEAKAIQAIAGDWLGRALTPDELDITY